MALTQVNSDGIGDGAIKATDLENSGVTAGTYGSSSAIPAITVDAKGRITSASTSSIDSTAITNGTSNVSVAASGDITASRAGTTRLTVNSTGAEVVGDLEVSGTGYVGLPSGTTAQRPSSPSTGYFRYNSTLGSPEFYNGSNWIATNLIPSVSSVTGTIFAGTSSTLTVAVTNGTDTVDVVFKEGATTLATVSNVTGSSGSYSVTVPSEVQSQTAGDTITISVNNSDGTPSNNSVDKTVSAAPTGGTITTSGNYRIHTFTTSSSFVVPSGLTLSDVEYLVIAGGASGGRSSSNSSGGGGAGGYRCSVTGESSGGGASAESKLTLTADTYTVTVGAGGAARSGSNNKGNDGSSSAFGSITTVGGGGGACQDTSSDGVGRDGGSGGGACYGNDNSYNAGGSGTTGQGYAGGAKDQTNYAQGAGGGGAGEAGPGMPNSNNNYSTRGGNGVASSITGSSVTRAGGGGGAVVNDGGAAGGSGGGGAGNNGNATAGTANTGSGGGGASNTSGASGDGGSGIVIVRYQL